MYQSDYSKALDYFHKALKINEELGNKMKIAGNLNNIGTIFNVQSNYPKALEYLYKALKINTEINHKDWLARDQVNIGKIYSSQMNYPKALDYFLKALIITEEIENKFGVAICLGNIGETYLLQSKDSIIQNSENSIKLMMNREVNLNKAIEYSNKAIDIFKEIGELRNQSVFLNTLSE